MINKDFKNSVLLVCGITLVFAALCAFFSLPAAGLCLLAGGISVGIYIAYTRRRYRDIECLNNYLSDVCAGVFRLDVPDNAEGELSILKNNLYKIMLLLNSQNDALRKDKTYLSESLADISHQLKTPLTSITMMCDLLKTETDPENREKFTSVIESQTEKMNWLIITLLKISKLDAGTAEFREEPVHIASVLEKALAPFLITAELRNIRILQGGVKDFVFTGDENWSAEAVGNILKNCLEHMEDGGVLTLSTEQTTIYDVLRITDDGCGIPKDELPHIFERFYHGKNAAADSVGIGLALSKTIFGREHGEIEVQSREGVGTEFCIKFYKTIV